MANAERPTWNPLGLHDMLRGYVKTSLLRASFELRVFDHLAAGPVDAATVAGRVGASERGTRVLLDALAAIGLVRTADGGYRLVEGTGPYLLSTGAQYFGGAVRLGASDWEWDAQKLLAEAVRKGGTVMDTHALTPEFDYWMDFAEHTSWFNNGAAVLMAEQLGDWARERERVEVLDVACSHGGYGFNLAQRAPSVHIWGVDWPNVLEVTRRNAERLGLAERVEYIPGDMFEVPLGGPYDLVLLTNVLHHFSADRATELLARLAGVLRPGGRIAVVGHTYDEGATPETEPLPFMFSVIMLIQSDEGESHSVGTYRTMLTAAGFSDPRVYAREGVMHRLFIADRS
jgi:ubiquinone/menaquinone biosynthesis C-methylase UbiE